jgi:hypothetical protein
MILLLMVLCCCFLWENVCASQGFEVTIHEAPLRTSNLVHDPNLKNGSFCLENNILYVEFFKSDRFICIELLNKKQVVPSIIVQQLLAKKDDGSSYILQFMKARQGPPLLEKCLIKSEDIHGDVVMQYWKSLLNPAYFLTENAETENNIKLWFFKEKPATVKISDAQLFVASVNEQEIEMTVHCRLNNKQHALQLSKEAVSKLSAIVFKEPIDFNKQAFHLKTFYFHIDGDCYVLKLGKEYCQLIYGYYEHIKNNNKELTVVKPTIDGTSIKPPVVVKTAILSQDTTGSGSSVITMCCSLEKSEDNWIIHKNSYEINVLLTQEDIAKINASNNTFYLLVDQVWYHISQVGDKLLSVSKQVTQSTDVLEKNVVPFYQKPWFVGSLTVAIIASIIMFLKK